MQPKEQMVHHKNPRKPWEVVGADMFALHNKKYICIVDYYSKFPVIKEMEDLSAGNLTLICKIIFQNVVYPRK